VSDSIKNIEFIKYSKQIENLHTERMICSSKNLIRYRSVSKNVIRYRSEIIVGLYNQS